MEALDAAGRKVSLLNDEVPRRHPSYAVSHVDATPPSGASSPTSQRPWRLGSYDSQITSDSDAASPLTSTLGHSYATSQTASRASNTKRPLHSARSRSASNKDEIPVTSQDYPAKRYLCRFRDSHSCDRTFTTSGHALRHSNIHTAKKDTQCSYPGCQKKFTRVDNMKQHLRTHYKDKSRATEHNSAAGHEGYPIAAMELVHDTSRNSSD
ncbi:hypothetical protein LMH87_001439 [Akanthomyces muscarius]|uniref:C2H2-type domain-containing protein n=1 Tax=Akanthomyces muscarius TaxID=2231603 RepID=A0A9W8Q4A7_AKAMU|nr:hypothetical protein LMH87_001439 [Akanthomyces muscarius]KAJ4146880.1 hypothetical protein LMH87_001439 [Akanthomyces muscarius]